jgi:DNA/RNA endonuclease YhcR with UshA esterase domain
MRRFLVPFLLASAMCQTALAGKIPTLDARKTNKLFSHLAKDVVVRGKVLTVGKSDADKIRFLDFTTDRERGFVAAIFPAAYKHIGDLEKYKGQRVEVRGVLEAYKAKTQIKVTKASQLTLLPAK